jgi:DNA replication and repair protein RecF
MISHIRLQQFRSYKDAGFDLSPGVTIIAGPNASGKTNLLEAILMIAHGGSYRAKDAEMVSFDATWARLDAQTENGARIIKMQQNAGGTWRKSFEIDGQALARLMPARTIPVVLFEPNHLLLLSSSPDLRRSFLDDLIEQINPHFGATRKHYKRVLSQRNSLLKKNPRDLREQLFVWNVRLSELGGQIAKERSLLIASFNEQASGLYDSLAGRDNTIDLQYVSRFSKDRYETELLHKLEQSMDLDVLRGFTAYGPHRDDLGVLIDGRPMSETASRGETRTLVLALKILELEMLEKLRGQKPLLLLDDVFSELDGKRREALTAYVEKYQTFITTTDADIVTGYFHKRHKVITLRKLS